MPASSLYLYLYLYHACAEGLAQRPRRGAAGAIWMKQRKARVLRTLASCDISLSFFLFLFIPFFDPLISCLTCQGRVCFLLLMVGLSRLQGAVLVGDAENTCTELCTHVGFRLFLPPNVQAIHITASHWHGSAKNISMPNGVLLCLLK